MSRTEEFSELLHDIAMRIVPSDPKFIRKEDVTAEAYQREKGIAGQSSESPPLATTVRLAAKARELFDRSRVRLRLTCSGILGDNPLPSGLFL